MKTLKENAAKLLREAILHDKLGDIEEILVEEIWKKIQDSSALETDDINEKILGHVLKASQEVRDRRQKLGSPSRLNTFGDYIKLFLEEHPDVQKSILSLVGFDSKSLGDVEKNAVSLSSIPAKKLAAFCKAVALDLRSAKTLIEKSIKLYELNPTVSPAMARYSYKDGKGEKDKSMKAGVAELLLKANQRKPINTDDTKDIEAKSKAYISEFEKAYLEL